MAWLILILVLLAAAFGVLGAVIKTAAFLVLTIVVTLTALAAIAWSGLKWQVRRWEREGMGGESRWGTRPQRPRDLPSHDDRY
jgi:hypothetical protein